MASALLRRPFRLVSLRSLHHTAIASTTSNGLHQRVSQVAARWNKLSGYEEIAQLKDAVTTLERQLDECRQEQSNQRQSYLSAVSERSNSQRSISDLLSRKSSWSESDLARYTQLLHAEHAQSKREQAAEQAYAAAEERVQSAFDHVMRAIAQRYHQEHIWSDRIRAVSTWGSVGIAVLNVLVFTLAIFLVEPYKRQKLARILEQRLVDGEAHHAQRLTDAIASFDAQVQSLQKQQQSLPPSAASTGNAYDEGSKPGDPQHRGKDWTQNDLTLGALIGLGVALIASCLST